MHLIYTKISFPASILINNLLNAQKIYLKQMQLHMKHNYSDCYLFYCIYRTLKIDVKQIITFIFTEVNNKMSTKVVLI